MSIVLAKPVKDLIEEFEKLPGIGPKSAARIAYYFLNAPEQRAERLAENLIKVKKQIVNCDICFNLTDKKVCDICADPERSPYQICVVEEPLDVIAIENSNVFKGVYHVLGGVISPLAGVGPEDLRIEQLKSRIKELENKDPDISFELIIATNPTMEGEATSMYILDYLKDIKNITISRLARGLPTGADIEYADYMTLKKSIENRIHMRD